MNTISFSDVQRTKREAKRRAKQSPTVALGRCQDTVARDLFGVRDYHELLAHRTATINSTVVQSGGLARCSFCGIEFCPDLKEDRQAHQRQHDAFEEATVALKYVPRQHAEREALKKGGYKLLESDDLEKQVEGLLMVIRGWFDRSLNSAIDGAYWKQHPTFEAYVSFVIGDMEHLPPAPVNALVSRFGRVDGVIPNGRSYWYPPKK